MSQTSRLVVLGSFWTQMSVFLFGLSVLGEAPTPATTLILLGGLVVSTTFSLLAGLYDSRLLRQVGLCTHFTTAFGWAAWVAASSLAVVPISGWVILTLSVLVGAALSEAGLEWDALEKRNARIWQETQRRNLDWDMAPEPKVLVSEAKVIGERYLPRATSSYESGVFSVQ